MFLIYLLGRYWATGRGGEQGAAVNRKESVSCRVKMYRSMEEAAGQ